MAQQQQQQRCVKCVASATTLLQGRLRLLLELAKAKSASTRLTALLHKLLQWSWSSWTSGALASLLRLRRRPVWLVISCLPAAALYVCACMRKCTTTKAQFAGCVDQSFTPLPLHIACGDVRDANCLQVYTLCLLAPLRLLSSLFLIRCYTLLRSFCMKCAAAALIASRLRDDDLSAFRVSSPSSSLR
jgi:hypothetical protein